MDETMESILDSLNQISPNDVFTSNTFRNAVTVYQNQIMLYNKFQPAIDPLRFKSSTFPFKLFSTANMMIIRDELANLDSCNGQDSKKRCNTMDKQQNSKRLRSVADLSRCIWDDGSNQCDENQIWKKELIYELDCFGTSKYWSDVCFNDQRNITLLFPQGFSTTFFKQLIELVIDHPDPNIVNDTELVQQYLLPNLKMTTVRGMLYDLFVWVKSQPPKQAQKSKWLLDLENSKSILWKADVATQLCVIYFAAKTIQNGQELSGISNEIASTIYTHLFLPLPFVFKLKLIRYLETHLNELDAKAKEVIPPNLSASKYGYFRRSWLSLLFLGTMFVLNAPLTGIDAAAHNTSLVDTTKIVNNLNRNIDRLTENELRSPGIQRNALFELQNNGITDLLQVYSKYEVNHILTNKGSVFDSNVSPSLFMLYLNVLEHAPLKAFNNDPFVVRTRDMIKDYKKKMVQYEANTKDVNLLTQSKNVILPVQLNNTVAPKTVFDMIENRKGIKSIPIKPVGFPSKIESYDQFCESQNIDLRLNIEMWIKPVFAFIADNMDFDDYIGKTFQTISMVLFQMDPVILTLHELKTHRQAIKEELKKQVKNINEINKFKTERKESLKGLSEDLQNLIDTYEKFDFDLNLTEDQFIEIMETRQKEIITIFYDILQVNNIMVDEKYRNLVNFKNGGQLTDLRDYHSFISKAVNDPVSIWYDLFENGNGSFQARENNIKVTQIIYIYYVNVLLEEGFTGLSSIFPYNHFEFAALNEKEIIKLAFRKIYRKGLDRVLGAQENAEDYMKDIENDFDKLADTLQPLTKQAFCATRSVGCGFINIFNSNPYLGVVAVLALTTCGGFFAYKATKFALSLLTGLGLGGLKYLFRPNRIQSSTIDNDKKSNDTFGNSEQEQDKMKALVKNTLLELNLRAINTQIELIGTPNRTLDQIRDLGAIVYNNQIEEWQKSASRRDCKFRQLWKIIKVHKGPNERKYVLQTTSPIVIDHVETSKGREIEVSFDHIENYTEIENVLETRRMRSECNDPLGIQCRRM